MGWTSEQALGYLMGRIDGLVGTVRDLTVEEIKRELKETTEIIREEYPPARYSRSQP